MTLFPLRDAYAAQASKAFRTDSDADIAEMNRLHAIFAASPEFHLFTVYHELGTFGFRRVNSGTLETPHIVAAFDDVAAVETAVAYFRRERGWTVLDEGFERWVRARVAKLATDNLAADATDRDRHDALEEIARVADVR